LKAKRIQNFFALKRFERVLLLRSFFVVGLIRAGLLLISLPDLIKILHTLCRSSSSRIKNSMDSIAWAVMVTSRYIPHATCLVQGLATQVLLACEGIPSDLCIGVSKEDPSPFEAHAWVETSGTVIIGGPQQHRYTRLTCFTWGVK
jgi:hypothetical protein